MAEKRKRSAAETIQQYDLLKKHHRFLRESSEEDEDRAEHMNLQSKKGEELAKKYYDKLYKEYVLVNLKRFESGQIGCRWRTEKEVLAEKGERVCGEVACQNPSRNIFEMNFAYQEDGQRKHALVKVSVCLECAFRLNFKKKLKQIS